MKENHEIKSKWEDMITEYSDLFRSNYEIWIDNFNLLKIYVDKNKRLPLSTDKIKEIKQLGRWILNQKQNYTKNKCIMKDPSIRQQWEEFTSKYPHLF